MIIKRKRLSTRSRRRIARIKLGAGLICPVFLLLFLAGCQQSESEKEAKPSPKPDAAEQTVKVSDQITGALAEFNRGAALIEQYRYSEAAAAFQNVLKVAPDWTAARFNLGLALLNQQGKTELETGRETFETILASEPNHLYAKFCLGMYYQHLGNMEEALEYFQAVHEADPEDPYAAYKCAETYIATGLIDEGTKILEQVVAEDPGFISAVYRLAMQYQRKRDREKALALFDRFQQLKEVELTAGHFTVQKVYGTAGKYYMALGADDLPIASGEDSPEVRIVFSPETKPLDARFVPWEFQNAAVGLPGIAVGDVDGDRDLDLCLAGTGEDGAASIWLNDGQGSFAQGATLTGYCTSPCFGDVDNDGDLDLWLGRAGPDMLWENDGKGSFSQTELSGVGSGEFLTACARLADLDSDGDLDLIACQAKRGSVPTQADSEPAASAVWNNNRDGTFEDIAEKLGVSLADRPIASIVYDDFDNDRDLDMILLAANDQPSAAWVNGRAWQYELLDAEATGLAVQGVVSATAGDPDRDGDRDLLVFCRNGLQLFLNQGGFHFAPDQAFSDQFSTLAATGGQFADMDNDGDLDIVVADASRRDGSRGPMLLLNNWPKQNFRDVSEVDPGNLLAALRTEGDASCVAADFNEDGRTDILLAPAGGQPFLVENATEGGHWIALDLVGARTRDNKSRSNHSAIGARVEVKSGTVFQQFTVGVPSGPVAMPPLRVHAGLGRNAKIEWLRIIWPDAVLQAEVELPGDQVATISEIQRKVSSCPHLFAWNGERFEFVADFGGVGGLGYLIAPGSYAPPDPTEYVPIPRLEPVGEEYVVQVTEPLEEVVYFDEAKLIAVDHPEGTEVYPREMMAVGLPPPPYELLVVDKKIEPLHAVDHRGVDVTDKLCRIDRRYAGATDRDRRFTGYAKDHFVELDFGDALAEIRPDARLVLFAHGWVEYSYSSTNFAASQAGVRLKAPSVHVFRDGEWVELFHEAGYPAGLRHMMTLDVTGKIRASDRKIRITSNMELYWDRIFLAVPKDDLAISTSAVAAQSADLHFLGYPREFSPDGMHPNLYDYSNIDRTVAWKLMSGNYTRFGEVGELLEEADDRFVIMGRGEELTLRFPSQAFGPVPKGCRRSFILKTDSYCKDMDLYTAHPDTVEPLPFHGMSQYPYGDDECYPDKEETVEYRRKYNTRRVNTR
jgi:tetratricopeptide (TPR) repeat protein